MESNALRVLHPKNGNSLYIKPDKITNFKIETLSGTAYEFNVNRARITNLEYLPEMDTFVKLAKKNNFGDNDIRFLIDYAKKILHK